MGYRRLHCKFNKLISWCDKEIFLCPGCLAMCHLASLIISNRMFGMLNTIMRNIKYYIPKCCNTVIHDNLLSKTRIRQLPCHVVYTSLSAYSLSTWAVIFPNYCQPFLYACHQHQLCSLHCWDSSYCFKYKVSYNYNTPYHAQSSH